MHCAACVGRVEKVLLRVEGVEAASVNFATGQAAVDLRAAVAPEQLIAAVTRAGYNARVSRLAEIDEEAKLQARELRSKWSRAAFAGVVALPALVLMWPGLLPHDQMASVNLGFIVASVLVIGVSGRDFYQRAALGLRIGRFDMDTLVALGTAAATIHAVLNVYLDPHAHTYLDAVPTVIGAVLAGQALELRARRQTGAALRSLLELAPTEALLLREGVESVVPLAALRPGDRVRVRPHDRVPVDGEVEEGRSMVDQSMLTGEVMPVERGPGDKVVGGTLNGPSMLILRATAVGEDAVLSRIIDLVSRAQATRPPVAALVDRVAGVFVPAVLGIAVCAAVAWSVTDPLRGVMAGLAVLVVACPCALGLATPISLVVGLGNAARAGVLLRDGAALQTLSELDTVVFDKTGTLTLGQPVVRAYVELPSHDPLAGEAAAPPEALLALAAAADRSTNHPLGRALLREALLHRDDELPEATEVTVTPGQGVEALVDGWQLRVGRPSWVGLPPDQLPPNEGTPIGVRARRAGWVRVGVVHVADTEREGAAEAVAGLRALGLRVLLLSGDTEAEAQRLARRLGITEVIAGVLPDGKVAVIRSLQADGRRVAMVGDGINDAPALAAADVGIAMGTGTEVAMEAAAVTLSRSDPRAVVDAIVIARETLRNVKQNLWGAFGYNVLAIPIAAAGWLHPAIAGAAMALSSVTVVANARRLARRTTGVPKKPVL